MTITGWRKAARSSYNGSCLEAGNWRTSSFSMSNGDCAEAASCGHGVAVRDSKLGALSPVLVFRGDEWERFLGRVKGDAGVAH